MAEENPDSKKPPPPPPTSVGCMPGQPMCNAQNKMESERERERAREGERCGMGWNRLENWITRLGIHTLNSRVTSFKSLTFSGSHFPLL